MTGALRSLGWRLASLFCVGFVTLAVLTAPSVVSVGKTAAPRAEAIPGDYFGMTINRPLTTPWPDFTTKTLRAWDLDIAWTDINPARGKFQWERFDAIVDLVHSKGADLVYTFGRTPRWASAEPDAETDYGPGQCGEPKRIEDWDALVRAVVERAAGRIKYWEIWNEPQDPKFYCGGVDKLVAMQKRAYAIIKIADPSLQVLTPAPVGAHGPPWMARFLRAGGGDYADIMAFHGYWDDDPHSVVEAIRRFKQVFEAGGQRGKPLWNTEGGWGQQLKEAAFDSEWQVAFIAKYYLLQWSEGVDRTYWYADDNELGWGTLWDKRDGLRPAGRAYAQVLQWMAGAIMTKPCALQDAESGLWTCTLSRANGYSALVAWRASEPLPFAVPEPFTRVRDLDGRERATAGRPIELGARPMLFESNPIL